MSAEITSPFNAPFPAPFRQQFDAARDPYTARNALGIVGTGGGGAPTNAEYITGATDPTLTNERVLTNTASITWDFSTPGQAKANAVGGGNVSNVGTPASGQWAQWTDPTHIQGIATALMPFVQKAGDTMTGELDLVYPGAAINFVDTSPTGNLGVWLGGCKGTVNDWRWWLSLCDHTVETGGNSGSNVHLERYDDGANYLDTPLTISRATGEVTLTHPLNLPGDPVSALQAAPKQYVDTRAPLASPVFTGDPKAPTPATADNDTSIATTAFVKAQGYVTGGPFQPLDGDLTSLAAATGTNTIYFRSAVDTWSPVTIGANLTFSGGTLAAIGGGGDAFLANTQTFTGVNTFTAQTIHGGVGAAGGVEPLIVQTTTAAGGNAALYGWNASPSQSPYLVFRRSKGGAIGSHVAVGLNDNLGMIVFQGSSGSLFQVGATIQALTAAAPVGGLVPASLAFTTVNLSGISGERMRLWPSGGLILDPAIGANDPGLGGLRARRYAAHQLTDSAGADGYGMVNSAGTYSGYMYMEGTGAMAMAGTFPSLNFRFGTGFPLCGQFNDSGFSAGMNNNVVVGGNQFCGFRWGYGSLQPLGLFFGGNPPTFNAMNGSIYINAAGSLGSHIYIAANGAYVVGNNWVAIPGV